MKNVIKSVLTKERNNLKRLETTHNDLQRARNDLKQPENNLQRVRNDLKQHITTYNEQQTT